MHFPKILFDAFKSHSAKMTTLNKSKSMIANIGSRLLKTGLAIGVNLPVPFKVGDRTRLSWPQARLDSGLFSLQPYASISEYRAFLTGNHFTFLLNEGSLLQVSFDFRHDKMLAHRYCFYPCPLMLAPQPYVNIDELSDLLELELIRQIEALKPNPDADDEVSNGTSGLLRLRSPIRFDFESENRPAHEPESHLHISSSSARVPVHAPISLAHFIRFVLRHFYPEFVSALEGVTFDHYNRCITASDELDLHINCRYAP
jgi:hypothetical protein